MTTILHLVVDPTEIQSNTKFLSALSGFDNCEYTSGNYWLSTDHAPLEIQRILAPAAGDAFRGVWRVNAETFRDAVVDDDTRAWLARQGIQVPDLTAAA
jgi:hypothetical protein